ncbi:MAG TPA: TonB-dependent receptor plug domain-containing protein [Verrucomicrobiae bacterium]|nr:TonB-dependent receptor plug domain-containing protein [Verrucomicrobiae bacterium]
MMKKLIPKIPSVAARIALAGSCLLALPALAQDTNAPTVMKPTVVTGSFIPTAETVGVAPVDTVGSTTIRDTGTGDILTALQTVSPNFNGSGNIGQSVNNGGFGEAYIALRNLPTLVLIDGKRVNISPFSTFIGTYAVDVNTIPVGMIDRIEILKDGASTLYGSDAVGGVVNIITKKGFNGAQFDGYYGFGLDQGTYNEYRADALVGYDKNGTRLLIGGQFWYNDPLYTSDRQVGSMSAAQLAAQGINAPTYFSGSFPGRADTYILAGSDLAQGATGPGGQSVYVPGLTTPPVIGGGPYNSVDAYNAAALASPVWQAYLAAHHLPANLAPYIPISDTPTSRDLGGSPSILNTSLLGTYSVQKSIRENAFANLEQDVFEDRLTAYGQFMFTHEENRAQLAPAPIPSLGLYNLTFPANNPYNAFGQTLGIGQTDGPAVRSRLVETGPREFITSSDFWHFLGGLKGKIVDDYQYDVNAAYSQTTSRQEQNSASSILLNEAMTPGAGGLSALGTPIYNILALPGYNSPGTINAIRASAGQGGFSDLLDTEGVFQGKLFDLPGGAFHLAIGAQYIRDSLDATADPLLASGNLIGLNALPVFSGGARDREAGFAEATIPVTKPDMDITGLHSLEIDAQGRYEAIQWGSHSADSAVPKVGFRWQPIDEQVTVRGTYSQAFVVPALFQLFGPPLNSNPTVVTPSSATDQTPLAAQDNINYISNPDIPPSTADTMTLGFVYSPKQVKGLTVSADYYHIYQEGVVYNPSPTVMVADLNARGAASMWNNNPALHGTPVYLDQNNNVYLPTPGDPSTYINANTFGTLNVPTLPGARLRTEGIDFALNYRIEAGAAGVINLYGNANLALNFQQDLGSGWLDYKGQYTDAQVVPAYQGLIPDWNVDTGFTWSLYNFDWTVMAHYLPGASDLGDSHPAIPSVGAPVNNFTANGMAWHISDFYTIDMRLAYNVRSASGDKWYDHTQIAIGCRNITDNLPPLIASSSEDNTDKAVYDFIGRFVYVQLSKKF